MSRKYMILVWITSCCCIAFCQSTSKQDELQGVKVSQVAPILDTLGKLVRYDSDTVEIYYSGNIRLYYLSYQFDSVDLITKESYLSEKRYHYFIYNIDSAYGHDFDVHRSLTKKRLRVDSLLHWQWTPSVNVYPIITVNKTHLLNAFSNLDSGTTHEWYAFSNGDTTAHGTVFFGYSKKLNDLPYSLSREMDSIKQMKLYKVRYTQDPRHIKEAGITVDKVNSEYNLERITAIRSEIIQYFQNYRRGK